MDDAVFTIETDFSKNVEIEVDGWTKKLKILYGMSNHAGVSYLCWKIEETEQIFRIQSSVVYEKHGIKFSDHFKITLLKFREDYLEWKALDFPKDWMKRYYRMFNLLIK